MTSAWASVMVAAVIGAGGLGAFLSRVAYRAGRVEEVVERLTQISERQDSDIRRHDGEIRELQRRR